MINNKTYDFITFSELLSGIRGELRKYQDEGYIEEANLIKTVMTCNEKMGLVFSDIKQVIIKVNEYKADIPLDFYKMYYACVLNQTSFSLKGMQNPFNNTIDQTVTYEADIQNGIIGCTPHTTVIYKKEGTEIKGTFWNWDEVSVNKKYCHHMSPLNKKDGKWHIDFTDTEIITPFRTGEIYMMYMAAMRNEEGEILVPFHPMITPWYEAVLTEKILRDVIMNSDDASVSEKYKLARQETGEKWLDAWNFASDRTYKQMMEQKKEREMKWHNKYYKMFY